MVVKTCRDESAVNRVAAITLTFDHLSFLAKIKNPHAGSLYKLLTFSYIHNFNDELTREMMSFSFIDLFQTHRGVPIEILLDPLLKHFNQAGSNFPDLAGFDFKLLYCLIQHRKMKLGSAAEGQRGGHAIDLMKYLARFTLKNPFQALQTSSLMAYLYIRFKDEESMQAIIQQLFEMYMEKLLDANERLPRRQTTIVSGLTDDTQDLADADLQLRARAIVKVALSLYDVSNEDVKPTLQRQVEKTQKVLNKLLGKQSQALAKISSVALEETESDTSLPDPLQALPEHQNAKNTEKDSLERLSSIRTPIEVTGEFDPMAQKSKMDTLHHLEDQLDMRGATRERADSAAVSSAQSNYWRSQREQPKPKEERKTWDKAPQSVRANENQAIELVDINT